MAACVLAPVSAQVDPLAPLPAAPAAALPSAPPAALPAARPPTLPAQAIQRPQWAAPSPPGLTGFAAYKLRLADRARRAGVREAMIQSIVPWLSLNSRVIQLDRGQPGGVRNPNAAPPFAPYRRRHVTSDLINRGASRYAANRSYLLAIEARTGVQASVLMAIFGHETSYGRVTGSFDLLEALATLAYEGRRRAFFEDEFVAAMQLIDRGSVARSRLRGSWAGATGYPQFMPSAVLRLRTDGDGDGRADIWSNQNDALASIAAYLRDAGWKPNVPWGIPVRVPYGLSLYAKHNGPQPTYQGH